MCIRHHSDDVFSKPISTLNCRPILKNIVYSCNLAVINYIFILTVVFCRGSYNIKWMVLLEGVDSKEGEEGHQEGVAHLEEGVLLGVEEGEEASWVVICEGGECPSC